MKTFTFAALLLLMCCCTKTTENRMDEAKIQLIEDRLALKELVDVFSNLADTKDTSAQGLLFTEDAVVDSYGGDSLISHIEGRNNLTEGFAAFLSLFDTVYHLNGQQTVEINGNKATGICYTQVVLIGKDKDGKRMMNTQGVRYNDEYIKIDGKWLIANRKSHFMWNDIKEAN